MTRSELIDRLSRAIAKREGFYATAAQAKTQKLQLPTRAQRNANPGNVRKWRDSRNRTYPRSGGCVDFVTWASDSFPSAAESD
jgi:hypothetical protein